MQRFQGEPIITQEIRVGNMADVLYLLALTCLHEKGFLRYPLTIYLYISDYILNYESPSILIKTNLFTLMTCLSNHLKRQKHLAA